MNVGKIKVFRWFKSKLIRWYLNSNTNKLNSSLNEEQQSCIKIVKLLASQSESEILMAPISEKFYIKNGEIFIIIAISKISIINSVYHYDISTNEKMDREIYRVMRRVLENRRNKLEIEMRSKVKKSLSGIATQLSTRFNNKGEV
jgi:hypothetical protein